MPKTPPIPAETQRIMAQFLKLPPKPHSEMKVGKKKAVPKQQKPVQKPA